jgi:hypothetical protein
MPSDVEMSDSHSPILDIEIALDPAIIANIKPAPERVVYIGVRSIFQLNVNEYSAVLGS